MGDVIIMDPDRSASPGRAKTHRQAERPPHGPVMFHLRAGAVTADGARCVSRSVVSSWAGSTKRSEKSSMRILDGPRAVSGCGPIPAGPVDVVSWPRRQLFPRGAGSTGASSFARRCARCRRSLRERARRRCLPGDLRSWYRVRPRICGRRPPGAEAGCTWTLTGGALFRSRSMG